MPSISKPPSKRKFPAYKPGATVSRASSSSPAKPELSTGGLWDSLRGKFTKDPDALPLGPHRLHVYTNTTCQLKCQMCYAHAPSQNRVYFKTAAKQALDLETFKVVLREAPTVREIVFSGWGEPLLNDALFQMVTLAKETLGTCHCSIVTNGLQLKARRNELLANPPDRLVISLNGHNPLAYQAMTGMSPEHFHTVLRETENLIKARKHHAPFEIYLSMIVDVHNAHEIADMIEFSDILGVDGLILENYTAPDPTQRSPRSLVSHTELAMQIQKFQAQPQPIHVIWPRLLDANMHQHRNCRDAFSSVSVDGEGNISACSRQWLYHGKMGKIWEANFWHNARYQWLRGVHTPKGKLNMHEVPKPCQNCPSNIPG